MKDVDLMKACQKGFGDYNGALQDANNLLAECYGTIGRLREDLARCRHQASFCIGNEEGLKQQLEKIRIIANQSINS